MATLSHAFKGQLRLAKLPKIIRPDPNNKPIPSIVSLQRLPYPLQFWIKRCVENREVSYASQEQAAEGKLPWMRSDPEHFHKTGIVIPNPFLRHRLELFSEDFSENPKTESKVIAPINRRQQQKMVKKYPAVLLPPSVRNPIENTAVISMHVEGLGTRLIRYGPDWKWYPEIKKGMYAGRAQIFKGHKRERVREIRQQEMAERVEGMDERIRKWREARRAEKNSGKSSMPW